MPDITLHTNMPIDRMHRLHRWDYTNEADRLAATGFTTDDVDKVAIQRGTPNTFWRLAVHDPAAWEQVGGGDLEPATDTDLGGVIIEDTSGLAVDGDGKLSVAPATDTQRGGVIVAPGSGLEVDGTGLLSIVPSYLGMLITLSFFAWDNFADLNDGNTQATLGLSWAGDSTTGDEVYDNTAHDTFDTYSDGETVINEGNFFAAAAVIGDPFDDIAIRDNFSSYADGTAILTGGTNWSGDSTHAVVT